MPRVSAETKQITRNRLLDAAAAEFAEHGLEGANINRISTGAGLAKGTVYNYFDSKRDLFLAVCVEGCVRASLGADDLEPDASTRDQLRALAEADVQWARENDGFARVLTREALSGDPRFAPQVLEAAAPWLTKVNEVLATGVERGEVRDDVPTLQLALLFSGFIQLALVQHWGSAGVWPSFEEIPELVLRQFLEGAHAQ